MTDTELAAMWNGDAKAEDIAVIAGVSRSAVCYRAKRIGLAPRTAKLRAELFAKPQQFPKPQRYRCCECGACSPTRICTAPHHGMPRPPLSLYIEPLFWVAP